MGCKDVSLKISSVLVTDYAYLTGKTKGSLQETYCSDFKYKIFRKGQEWDFRIKDIQDEKNLYEIKGKFYIEVSHSESKKKCKILADQLDVRLHIDESFELVGNQATARQMATICQSFNFLPE